MISAETGSKVNMIRAKMAQGQEVTDDEMLEVVRLLRADRMSAATASANGAAKRATKAAALNINGDDLLSEMM